MEPAVQSDQSLSDYLHFLYDGLEGYAYMALKNPQDENDWHQKFFSVPTDVGSMEKEILSNTKDWEVYVSPSVFNKQRADKESFKASHCVWTEFDGNAPEHWDDSSQPSLIIQSSDETRHHVYWRLTEPVYSSSDLEKINRNITYNLSADPSAWDATQVLRPPYTVNHKRQRDTHYWSRHEITYAIEAFDGLAPAPEVNVDFKWELGSLPNPQDVILRYAFGPDLIKLLGTDKPEDRSKSLMHLAHGCCELGMSDVEVFVTLTVADDKWGKFKNRKDREQRLADIIARARTKHPSKNNLEEEDQPIFAFGFESFLNTDIEIEWLMENVIAEQGSMLMVGPSGVGKTQFSLQAIIHICLGKDFLGRKVAKPKKIIFLSLEMGHGELKVFMKAMNKVLTDADRAVLENNLIVVPWGEPWALNREAGQDYLNNLIELYTPDGIFIDSVGSAIEGNISEDNNVQPYTKYIDHIRKHNNLFTWVIHHFRKKSESSHGGYSQDDVYGNQYLFNRSTSCFSMTRTKNKRLRIKCLKMRLADTPDDIIISRDKDTLTFKEEAAEVVASVDKSEFKDIKYKQKEYTSEGIEI